MKRISLVVSLFLVVLGAGAQSIAPKYSNEFLHLGVGARGLGMAQSQAASVNDVTAGYWNPAGLLGMKAKLDGALMHNEYFGGISKYDYLALGKKIDTASAVGVSLLRFGVDDIPNTIDLYDPNGNVDYSRVTTFNAADYAMIVSYARKGLPHVKKAWVNKLQWGGSAKVIYRNIGSFANAFGFGFDLGAQYRGKHLLLGAVVRDVTSTFSAWSFSLGQNAVSVFNQTGNALPKNGLELSLPRAIVGVGYQTTFLQKYSVLAETNIRVTTDGRRNDLFTSSVFSIDPSAGIELGYVNTIFFRAGVGNFQRQTDFDNQKYTTFQPNLGVGIRLRKWFIDYAISNVGSSSLLPSNVFSLKFVI